MINPFKIEFKNSVKAAMVSYCNCIRKLEKSTGIKLVRKQVLSSIYHDRSGLLNTFCYCKKCIESTVRTGTHVKPVFFTVNIFAVYQKQDIFQLLMPNSSSVT